MWALGREQQEDPEFKCSLGSWSSSRPAWVISWYQKRNFRGMEVWLRLQRTCLASLKPWTQTLAPKNKNKKGGVLGIYFTGRALA
jgi:hypothetical protein